MNQLTEFFKKIINDKKNLIILIESVVAVCLIIIAVKNIIVEQELKKIPMKDRHIAPPTQTITKVAPVSKN